MNHQKKKAFLKIPEYPGGKPALKKFIKENLVYPEKAKEAGIKGIVFLSAEIDDNGNVGEVKILNGLGYGCDEEAIRVVKLLKFGSVTNRGKRLKTRKKFRVAFKPDPQPKKTISYSIKTKTTPKEPSVSDKQKKYGYTIIIKK